MSNDELQLDVSDELVWDPKIDSGSIAVAADDGVVTLKGTVGSFREKREAKKAAERVQGVKSVDDKLRVRLLLNSYARDDADLRGAVLQALMLDSAVPSTIDAKVSNGIVTLTGTAQWRYQLDEAEKVAGNVMGVVGVGDEVNLINPTEPGDVQKAIEHAFKRNAKLDAKGISVESNNGTITLTGAVSSWAEHDEALDAAWSAPGVTDVEDHIAVEY